LSIEGQALCSRITDAAKAVEVPAHLERAGNWDDLATIRQHGTNLTYWPRRLDPHMAKWMAELGPALLPDFDADGGITEVIDAWYQHTESMTAELPESGWLVDDVLDQLMGWVRITKALQARVGLEWVDSDNCMKFHTDQVHIRLLCTYVGPGTWWVPNHLANRDRLGLRGDNDDIVPTLEAIREIPTGAIALLKGDAFDHTEPGIIHRSPPIAARGLRRLLLRIDDPQSCGCGTC